MSVVPHASAADVSLWCSPFEVFTSGWRNRTLIGRLARREIEARYRGSILGLAWSLLVPLILLAVFTFIFSIVFRAKFGDLPERGRGQFALILFSGLILFNVFAECLNRAPTLMLQHAGYIKKVVFPLEVLPWVVLCVALFNAVVSIAALVVGYLLLLGLPPASAVLWPLMLLPVILATLGLTWFLAAFGVYLRDLQQFVPVVVTVLLYLSPIFYPLTALPVGFQRLVMLSPLAVAIEEGRDMLFAGRLPNWPLLGAHLLLAWLIAWLGYMFFRKTRKGFADVV